MAGSSVAFWLISSISWDLTSFKIEHYHGSHKQARAKVKYPPLYPCQRGRRVLLVDDVSDSSDTFEIALEHLRTRGAPAIVRTAVIHHKIQSLFMPDFHARFPCPISMPDFHARKIVKWHWLPIRGRS